jgi:hypothetical protein
VLRREGYVMPCEDDADFHSGVLWTRVMLVEVYEDDAV